MTVSSGSSDSASMQDGSPEKNEPELDLTPWGAAVQFVLKNNDYFAVFGVDGNMNGPIAGTEAEIGTAGLFFSDTRYLSRLVLKINGLPPVPLGSSMASEEGQRTLNHPSLSSLVPSTI